MALMGYVCETDPASSIQKLAEWQVIPRNILEQAKGFAIFTIFKAGFVFSARAGSGIVIARLEDGSK